MPPSSQVRAGQVSADENVGLIKDCTTTIIAGSNSYCQTRAGTECYEHTFDRMLRF